MADDPGMLGADGMPLMDPANGDVPPEGVNPETGEAGAPAEGNKVIYQK